MCVLSNLNLETDYNHLIFNNYLLHYIILPETRKVTRMFDFGEPRATITSVPELHKWYYS